MPLLESSGDVTNLKSPLVASVPLLRASDDVANLKPPPVASILLPPSTEEDDKTETSEEGHPIVPSNAKDDTGSILDIPDAILEVNMSQEEAMEEQHVILDSLQTMRKEATISGKRLYNDDQENDSSIAPNAVLEDYNTDTASEHQEAEASELGTKGVKTRSSKRFKQTGHHEAPKLKKKGHFRYKSRIESIMDVLPKDPPIKRRHEENKRLRRQDSKRSKLAYEAYLDKNRFQFTDRKPIGQGAIDLTTFGIGKQSRPPTLKDIKKLENKDLSDIQTGLTVAFDFYKSMPKKQLEDIWSKVAPDNVKQHNLLKQLDKLKAAGTLAALSNVKQVKYLAWVPETSPSGEKLLNQDGTLKGKYVCKYIQDQKRNKNNLKEMTVGTDWVEKNFSVILLAYIQRLGYQRDLETVNALGGFTNVEAHHVTFVTEDIQFNSVRYIPSHTVQKGNIEEKIPEKWLVYSNAMMTREEVTYDYLRGILDELFLEHVKRRGINNCRAFVDIPPGDYREHDEYPKDLVKGPEQHYWQQEKTRTCLTTAFANLLWFCNCRKHASAIYTSHKLCQYPNALVLFKEKLLEMSKMLKYTNAKLTLEDLHGRLFRKPVVTCVKGDNNKEDHTIVIYKGYIFDGNFSHALPLCPKALDDCCSSKEKSCGFVRFVNSFYLHLFDKYMAEMKVQNEKKGNKK